MVTAIWIILLLGAAPVSPTNMWAAQLFAELGARAVLCPAYTRADKNEPLCAQTELSAEAFIRAFDRARGDGLEPLDSWYEDHGVWLRRYRRGERHYAVVYTTIARTFNVQLVCLKCK